MNQAMYDLFVKHDEMELSTVPCRLVMDKKLGYYTGKVAAEPDWSRLCDERPEYEDYERWAKMSVSGLGIVTGRASNICCVDIDTEDEELINRIKEAVGYTPCVVKGNPRRGGKLLFRIAETRNEINIPFTKKKVGSCIDILVDRSYICMPPSIHSMSSDRKEKVFYKWENEDQSIDKVGIENLPILKLDGLIERLDMIVNKGMTVQQANYNLPAPQGIDLSTVNIEEGRWQKITQLAGTLVAQNASMDHALRSLLDYDQEMFPSNSYFLDATKGCTNKSRMINAIKFYTDFIVKDSKGKGIAEINLPNLMMPISQAISHGVSWPDPIPVVHLDTLPKFDFDWIPNQAVREMVEIGSKVNGVSPQCIFFYMLGAFSSVIGNKMMVQPYHQYKDFKEACNLYVGIIASSGERKSETTNFALKPLKVLNTKLKKERKEQAAKMAQRNKDIDTRIRKLNKDREKEIEENGFDSDFTGKLLDEIHELENQKPESKKVSLYEQETTVQKLYEIVEDNPYGLFLEFNEWGAKYHSLLSSDKAEERQFILNGWDGKRPFSYRTKHQGENEIEKLCISVGFSCQNDVMQSIIWRLSNYAKENDGLMQRFFMVCSDSERKPVVDAQYEIKQEVYDLFESAYYIEEKKEPVMLSMNGYNRWMNFQERTKDKIMAEDNPVLASVISKYDGLIIRLAACLEVMKNNGNRPEFISDESYITAEKMIEYIEAHARALYKSGANKNINDIITQMKMSIIDDESRIRDLYKRHSGLFGRNSDDAMKILRVLHEHNIIRIYKEDRSDKIRINPKLLQGQ